MNFFDKISDITGGDVSCNEPMKRYVSFRAGGNAAYFAKPSSKEQIRDLILLAKEENVPYLVMGNGSNMLFSDEGFDGLVIYISKNYADIEICGDIVTAKAGAMLSKLGKECLKHSLTGFEFASGIPGCVGGAIFMNAGAYGGEMKDIVQSVKVLDEHLNIKEMQVDEMQFGYRSSIVEEKGYIVLEATFKLQKGDASAISQRMEELSRLRREKQPLEYPSAGSTFKRPQGHFAGKLIQDAGLLGYTYGGASVSTKHGGFIINSNNASASDIYCLMQQVKAIVKEKFDVELEPEVKLIGNFLTRCEN